MTPTCVSATEAPEYKALQFNYRTGEQMCDGWKKCYDSQLAPVDGEVVGHQFLYGTSVGLSRDLNAYKAPMQLTAKCGLQREASVFLVYANYVNGVHY